MTDIAVLIPTFRVHVRYLAGLLDAFAAQTKLPRWVIVSASSIEPEGPVAAELDHIEATAWPFELQILRTSEFAYASRNRNRAADEAIRLGAPLLSFFDCDDIPHPRRLEAIAAAFEKGADAVVHSFLQGGAEGPLRWPPHPPSPIVLFDSYTYKRGSGFNNVTQEEHSLYRVVYVDASGAPIQATYGHISLKASLIKDGGIRFQEDAYGYEDAIFMLDILHASAECVLLPYPYTYYVFVPAEYTAKWEWVVRTLQHQASA